MNEVNQGGFLISKIHHLGARIFSKKLKEHHIEIGPGQGRIIFALWQEDEIPIRKLAKRTALGKSTLTVLLDRLVEAGFVERHHHPTDRRVTLIKLTEDAKNMQLKYEMVSKEMSDLFYKEFAQKEIDHLDGYLKRLLSNLLDAENDLADSLI